MNLQRGPIPVLTLCAPEHAIKNYNRGLLSISQLIDQLRYNCISGGACPYDTAILFFEALQLSCSPHDFGATIFDYNRHEDYVNLPEFAQYQTWCDWYEIACRRAKRRSV